MKGCIEFGDKSKADFWIGDAGGEISHFFGDKTAVKVHFFGDTNRCSIHFFGDKPLRSHQHT
jgi:hypothetical protein